MYTYTFLDWEGKGGYLIGLFRECCIWQPARGCVVRDYNSVYLYIWFAFAGILFISKECGTLCKLGFSLPVDSDVIFCCTVDLLEAGSLHAALTRYLIFLQLLPLKMMMHTFGLSCTISHFSLRCRQWLWHVVYMFDLSGTSVFKMRGQYIWFDYEGTSCTFHPTGT